MHLQIEDDGILLEAELDLPENGNKKHPLVLVIHGFTGYKEERHILAASRTLNELGYATLRPDMYGHGASGGAFRNHTLFKWLGNMMTLIDYARGLDFVTDLYLCGHSQGGLIVALAAAMKADQIRAVIPMSPALMIPEDARRGSILGHAFDPERPPEEIPMDEGRVLSGNYLRAARMIHVEDAYRYRGPVLLIHGDADEAVPYACSVEAEKAYENATLVTIPGDDHCYDFHLDQVTEAIRRWMPKVE